MFLTLPLILPDQSHQPKPLRARNRQEPEQSSLRKSMFQNAKVDGLGPLSNSSISLSSSSEDPKLMLNGQRVKFVAIFQEGSELLLPEFCQIARDHSLREDHDRKVPATEYCCLLRQCSLGEHPGEVQSM